MSLRYNVACDGQASQLQLTNSLLIVWKQLGHTKSYTQGQQKVQIWTKIVLVHSVCVTYDVHIAGWTKTEFHKLVRFQNSNRPSGLCLPQTIPQQLTKPAWDFSTGQAYNWTIFPALFLHRKAPTWNLKYVASLAILDCRKRAWTLKLQN